MRRLSSKKGGEHAEEKENREVPAQDYADVASSYGAENGWKKAEHLGTNEEITVKAEKLPAF